MKFPLFIQVITERNKQTGKYDPGCYLEIDKKGAFDYARVCVMMRRPTYLYIPIQLSNGKHLPVVDVDNKDNSDEDAGKRAIDEFIQTGLFGMVIQSSHKSYWVILDTPRDSVKTAIDQIPYYLAKVSDTRYTQCVLETQQFVLRATPRDGFVPRIIYASLWNPETIEWAKDFEEWWSSSEIRELLEIQTLELL